MLPSFPYLKGLQKYYSFSIPQNFLPEGRSVTLIMYLYKMRVIRNIAMTIAILSLLPACEKGKVDTEIVGWHVQYQGSPIPIASLLPELGGNNITSEGGCYSILIPLPDVKYSYTTERIWLEPQDTAFTAGIEDFTPPEPFDTTAEFRFHSSNNLSFHGLHMGNDVERLYYGTVTGTLTIHISYPESLPFDKITLAENSYINLPSFLMVESRNCPAETAASNSLRITEDVVIPRSGYDFTFDCTFLSVSSPNHISHPLSGSFKSEGTILLSPDDSWDRHDVGWVPSLEISLSTSVVEFTRVIAVLNDPPEDEVVTVRAPFPTLSEQSLNDFNLAQVKTHVTTNNDSYHFSGKFFAQKGLNYKETQTHEFHPYSHNMFFSQDLNGVDYRYMDVSDYSGMSLNGLNDLVNAPLPDSIGFSLHVFGFQESFQPGCEYTISISNDMYIPLMFGGKDWGKTVLTDRITITAKEMEALPGTDVYIYGWVMNRQPFELKAIPVIVDADGVSHRFEEDAITVEGSRYFESQNGKKEFHVKWTAEKESRPIDFYLELTLGTGTYEYLTPGQDILFGVSFLRKEKIVER